MKDFHLVRRRTALGAVAGALLTTGALPSHAQAAFPSRPVRLLVSFPAGGSTDLIARELAKGLGDSWSVPVVVDNKPGASGVIAADALAKAQPDGHTMFLALYDTLVITPWVNERMPYDTFRDLVPVGLVATIPLVLVTSPASRLKNVADLVAAAKARPGELTYATTGIGGGQHLSMEMFQKLAGIKLTHVPYKGVAAGLQDVVSGRVSVMLASPSTASGFLQDGRLAAIANASTRRSARLPSVPTFAESGFPTFEASGWMGLLVPRGTPASVMTKASADLQGVVNSSTFAEAVGRIGNEANHGSAAEMAQRMRAEHDTYGQLIKQLDLKN